MRPVVFLGPTLDIGAARAVLDADYRPPARCGDVLRAVWDGARQIGIVDGLFHAVRSVRHAEILFALGEGVEVVGAASLGALRAAECADFGMVGVGEVFRRYRGGDLERDDAVAVLHADGGSGFRALSDALVDICDTTAAAVEAGLIDDAAATWLCAHAASLHYTERTFGRVVDDASEAGVLRTRGPVLAFHLERGPTLKQRDALAMLRYLASDDAQPGPCAVRVEVAMTDETRALIEEMRARWFPLGRIVPGTLRFERIASGAETALPRRPVLG